MDVKDIEALVDKSVGALEGKNKEAIDATKAAIVKDIEAKGYQSKDEVEKAVNEAVKEAKDSLEKDILELKKAALEVKASQDPKTFEDLIGAQLKEKKGELSNIKNGKLTKSSLILTKADE